MTPDNWKVAAIIVYIIAMVAIGFSAYARTKDFDDYVLGGRQLNPFVAALTVGASDMSGWLLMGLPGAIYVSGLIEGWIAVGLTIGAYINWRTIAPRLRAYTEHSGDSVTIPSFLESRTRDQSRLIRIVAGIIILAFFTFYVSSGMVAAGVFWESSFDSNYHMGLLVVSGVVVLYTLVGGFMAVSWTDAVQGMMMLIALIAIPIFGLFYAGGLGEVTTTINEVDPYLLSPFGDPALFGTVGIITLISALAWGFGYFGQPHILVRFMALRNASEATAGRRFGISWMILSVLGAGGTALVGIAIYKHNEGELPDPESVFITLAQLLFHPFIAGLFLAAILAAIMSTISSQLLVTASALVEDIWAVFSKKGVRDVSGMWMGRAATIAVAVVAALLAWEQNDTILALVAFAWAGFGASFGPVIILSMYWRKLTSWGVIAGMAVGAVTVGIWGNLPASLVESNPIFGLYEILPGFALALLAAWGVSLATYKQNLEVCDEFDKMEEEMKSLKGKKAPEADFSLPDASM